MSVALLRLWTNVEIGKQPTFKELLTSKKYLKPLYTTFQIRGQLLTMLTFQQTEFGF